MNDFSSPRRMSAGALIILMLKSFKEIAGASFLAIAYLLYDAYVSKTSDHLKVLLTAAALTVILFLVSFTKYYFRKFHIEGGKLIYTHGFASKNANCIPLSRVHTLRTKRGIFYRILNMRGVSFDTLAGASQEVELILTEDDWQMLLRRVKDADISSHPSEYETSEAIPSDVHTIKVSTLSILKGALCQNHLKGIAVLITIALAVFNQISDLDNTFSSRIVGYIDSATSLGFPSTWSWLMLALIIYLILMLLWVGKTILRYGNMTLRFDACRLTVKSGLFTRYTGRLAREKVSLISIKRNPLEKAAHCSTITFRQAKNVSGDKRESDFRIYGTSLRDITLDWWLGSIPDHSSQPILTAKSGKGIIARKFIPHLIPTAAATLIIIHTIDIILPTLILSASYLLFLAIRAIMAWKHSSISLHKGYVSINRGNIATIHEYLRYRDIESVILRSTPFTPITGRQSLCLTTNARTVTIFSLTRADARSLRHHILQSLFNPR